MRRGEENNQLPAEFRNIPQRVQGMLELKIPVSQIEASINERFEAYLHDVIEAALREREYHLKLMAGTLSFTSED